MLEIDDTSMRFHGGQQRPFNAAGAAKPKPPQVLEDASDKMRG